MPLNSVRTSASPAAGARQGLRPNLAAAGLGDPERARLSRRVGSLSWRVSAGSRRPRGHTCKPVGRHASVTGYAHPQRRSRPPRARACAALAARRSAGRAARRGRHRRRRVAARPLARRRRARRGAAAALALGGGSSVAVARRAALRRADVRRRQCRDARARRAGAVAARVARRRGHAPRSAGCSSR